MVELKKEREVMKETHENMSNIKRNVEIVSVIGIMISGIMLMKSIIGDCYHRTERVEDRILSIEEKLHMLDKKITIHEVKDDNHL